MLSIQHSSPIRSTLTLAALALAAPLSAQRTEFSPQTNSLWSASEATQNIYRLHGWVGVGTRTPRHQLTVKEHMSVEGADPAMSDGYIMEILEIPSLNPLTGAGGFTMRGAYPWPNGFRGRPRTHVLRYDGNTIFATDDNANPLGRVGIGTRDPKRQLPVKEHMSIEGADPGTSDGSIMEIVEIPSLNPLTGAGGFCIRAAYPWPNGFRGMPWSHVLRYDGNTILATDENGLSLGSVGIGTRNPQSKLHVAGTVTTDILTITGGSDIVEQFESTDAETPAPGTVMVIDADNPGHLISSSTPHDPCVAGVVAGAGGVNPGLSLSQENVLEGDVSVSLLGRTYVRCCDENGPVRAGDRLTTSSHPGVAMRASDQGHSDAAILGKAMTALERDEGLVLVLIK